MKNAIKIAVLGIVLGATSCASNAAVWRYETEAVSTGSQGSYLVKVWSYSSQPNLAIEQAKKNAVHSIIFRGFTGKQGVAGQKPLANINDEQIHKEYFDNFFKNGLYNNFVSLSGDGVVKAEDRLRVGNEYKMGVVVSVNVQLLRKELETQGIIKPLGGGMF